MLENTAISQRSLSLSLRAGTDYFLPLMNRGV